MGWASLDREIGDELARNGVPVIGWNSQRYFWVPKTPDDASNGLRRILRHYGATWKKQQFILVGYSRGAVVLPFMVSRLPPDLLEHVALVALVGPEHTANFEFHAADLLLHKERRGDLAVLPEVRKLSGTRLLCLYGVAETDTICSELPTGLGTAVGLPGGHHLDGAYQRIAQLILQEAYR